VSTVPGRSNGLTAASYVALVDLAPPLADALLDTLRVEAIAAYAAPATDRPRAELSARPPRPLDRVFVDRSASGRARAVLDAELARSAEDHAHDAAQADRTERSHSTDRADGAADAADAADDAADPGPAAQGAAAPDRRPGGSGSAAPVDDDVWAGIVASLQGPSAIIQRPDRPDRPDRPAPGPRGPASFDVLRDGEDVPRAGRGTDADADAGAPVAGPGSTGSTGSTGHDPVAGEPAPGGGRRGPDDDHYVPPVPPPLPRLDRIGKAAWAGAAGAPILLVLGALAGVDLSGWLGLLLVLSFVAGFVTLVVRMKDSRDDGWDDGAVV
jgi:hypothetical protein